MYDLMERAGEGLLKAFVSYFKDSARVLVVVGTGNNGGDGYVFARLAKARGIDVELASINSAKGLQGDAAKARELWESDGNRTADFEPDKLYKYDVIVDALLGTGITDTVRPDYELAITGINDSGASVLSVDVPSGLNADSGVPMEVAVAADVTVTFVGIKGGLVTGTGKHHCGTLVYDDLSIARAFGALAQSRGFLAGAGDVTPMPPRPQHTHKGHAGRVLCIGGFRGMAGAIRLSGEAALRSGAGLVKVFCHHDSKMQVSNGRPELMVTSDNLGQQMAWADVLVLGPGLGQESWGRNVFNEVISYLMHEDLPVVIDADGLNLLSHHLYKLQLSNLVITPHPAEAARLLNTTTGEVENDRYHSALELSSRFSGSAVLKGAGSIVATDRHLYVCKDGNPGMATAGMGDVLTGIAGAFLAQGMGHEHAALYSTCVHAKAADEAAKSGGQRGMLASDLFDYIRHCINDHTQTIFG